MKCWTTIYLLTGQRKKFIYNNLYFLFLVRKNLSFSDMETEPNVKMEDGQYFESCFKKYY